nr:FABP family protein [Rhodococcus sp. MSC1_016]
MSSSPDAGADPSPDRPASDEQAGDSATVRRGSGDAAVADAIERSKSTASRNIPLLPDLPLPEDTANLRLGPDLNNELLAVLPLVGVWRGEGEGHDPETGDYRFGQQIIVSHNGGNYLSWESQSWVLDSEGEYVRPDLRESGFWRISGDGIPGSTNEEVVELLLTHSSGIVELFYGRALTQSSWELATDVVIRSTSGALVGGAKRLYGIVEGGDLAYVEERIIADGELLPRLSARLTRYIG